MNENNNNKNETMQAYGDKVVNALPSMLNETEKGKAAITIASYLNTMLRNAETVEDFKIFANTVDQCQDFAQKNSLGGLNRTCATWIREGLEKWYQVFKPRNQQSKQSKNSEFAEKLQQFLSGTRTEINKIGMIDPDMFPMIAQQLDQVEEAIRETGAQYLSPTEIQQFIQEIKSQRERIGVNIALIEDIIATNHIKR